jgi:sirohydrochlorin cobaltochelatase
MTSKAWLICGHGTRRPEGAQEFLSFVDTLKNRHPDKQIEGGFLELSEPTYEAAVAKLYEQGVREIVAQPLLLFTGVHLKYDIPGMMHEYQKTFPGLTIRMGSFLGPVEPIVDLAIERISETCPALEEHDKKDTLLLAAPIGASVAEANGDAAKLTRLIWEKSRFGFATYGFVSRMAWPSVSDVLELIKRLPYNKVVIAPLTFFSGVYLERIQAATLRFKSFSPKEIFITEPLGNHDLLCTAVEQAIEKVEDGQINLMNDFDPNAVHHHHHHHHDHTHGHSHDHDEHHH